MTDHTPAPITSFSGQHDFLSNFYYTPVTFDGDVYPTAEHAFQAAKTVDPHTRALIRSAVSAGLAKRMGREVNLRHNWDLVRLDVMYKILEDKFKPGSELADRLVATHPAELIEGNNWGDEFWGVDVRTNRGQNFLGRTLMAVRANLLTQTPASPALLTDAQLIAEIINLHAYESRADHFRDRCCVHCEIEAQRNDNDNVCIAWPCSTVKILQEQQRL